MAKLARAVSREGSPAADVADGLPHYSQEGSGRCAHTLWQGRADDGDLSEDVVSKPVAIAAARDIKRQLPPPGVE